jgi:hypothetical protein
MTAGTTLCGSSCVNLATSASHCGECGYACDAGQQCVNGACRPTAATNCTAYRYGGHDYLVCPDRMSWTSARSRCREWNLDLAVITSADENAFVRSIAGNDRWIGANDRGDNGSALFGGCPRTVGSSGEGNWHWINPGNDSTEASRFCQQSGATTCSPSSGAYTNWASGEPNNSGCGCFFGGCDEAEDCGVLRSDGTWNDATCSPDAQSRPYLLCESY